MNYRSGCIHASGVCHLASLMLAIFQWPVFAICQ